MRECGARAVVPVREDAAATMTELKKQQRADWEEEVRIGGSLANVPLENEGVHGWASPPAPLFLARGPNYFQKKIKVPCQESLLRPLGVDWLRSNGRLDHILAHPENRVMQALAKASSKSDPFIFAVNLQVPGKEPRSAVFYFVTDEPILEGSLLYRFIHEDDAFRNSRFKMINRIVKGPWIVKAAAGNHPACLLGKALTCRYIVGRNYLEIDVDIASSTVANAILHLALGYVTTVSVDMAFLIESQTDDELPEKLLGAVRIAQIEMESAAYMEAQPQEKELHHENSVPSQQSGQYWRKFGKSFSKLSSSHGVKNGRTTADDQDQ